MPPIESPGRASNDGGLVIKILNLRTFFTLLECWSSETGARCEIYYWKSRDTRDEDFYSGNFLFMQMDSYQQISSRGDRCGSKAAPFIGRKCERIFLLCFYCRVIAVEAV